jgi:predicted acylesterase/phospholipase RssA
MTRDRIGDQPAAAIPAQASPPAPAPAAAAALPFTSVVLAGGGSRTFWHAGFWSAAAAPLGLRPAQIAAVSAGAAMACAIVGDRIDEALRRFQEATRTNSRNAYWGNVLGSEPVFPHERMYRRAIPDLIDAPTLARIHAGPDVRVLLAHTPPWLGPRSGALVAAAAYNLDRRLRGSVHPRLPRWLGFSPEVVSVRECATPEVLADLILGSSCTPPMTALQRWRGRHVLDGGVVDNVPVCALSDGQAAHGQTLVLLSRRYPRLPVVAGRTYVMPSEEVPITAWDYTNPAGLQAVFDLGRRDGDAFATVA